MRRLIVILILVVGLLLGTLILINLPNEWQEQAQVYLAFQRSTGGDNYVVAGAAQARRPWQFTPQMREFSLGNGIYITDDSFNPSTGMVPVPYPPEKVWCLLLETTASNTSTQQRVIFIAYHYDLYYADWVIHEAARSATTAELSTALKALGCSLSGLKLHERFEDVLTPTLPAPGCSPGAAECRS